jgi:hypothetical protein
MRRRTFSVIVANVMVVLAIALAATAIPASTALAATPDWTIQHSPNVTLPGGRIDSVSCTSATSCTAVGSFESTSGITDTLAEAWNGTSWTPQSTPDPAGAYSAELSAVSCPAAGSCEAGGYF